MGIISNVFHWVFGDDEESKKQYQSDIDDTMHIAYDPEESAMYDQFDEEGMVPHSHAGDEEDGPLTPPWDDPDDKGGGGFFNWLLGR